MHSVVTVKRLHVLLEIALKGAGQVVVIEVRYST
jgi:hypothetical protein